MADRPDVAPSLWDRPPPRPRRGAPPLDREAVVAAAIRLADSGGLDAVSVRRVAAELDAGPMRLYGVVGTKDELLELMVDGVHGEIVAGLSPRPSHVWPRRAAELARVTRTVTLEHEWSVDIASGRPHLGPNALAVLEATLAALAGVPDENLSDAKRSTASQRARREDLWVCVGIFNACLAGALRTEVAARRAARETGQGKTAWQTASGPHLQRMLDTGRYPHLASQVAGGPPRDGGALYDDLVARMLAGLAVPVSRRGRRTRPR